LGRLPQRFTCKRDLPPLPVRLGCRAIYHLARSSIHTEYFSVPGQHLTTATSHQPNNCRERQRRYRDNRLTLAESVEKLHDVPQNDRRGDDRRCPIKPVSQMPCHSAADIQTARFVRDPHPPFRDWRNLGAAGGAVDLQIRSEHVRSPAGHIDAHRCARHRKSQAGCARM
jgi:hypothetical protein